MRSRSSVTVAVLGAVVYGATSPVMAQGLLWTLPAEGAQVRYEGTVVQTEIRPDDPEGDLSIQWIRHLYLKSLNDQTVKVDGEDVPCRWIEIKSITGKESELGIDPGPVGQRIVKVLVPISAFRGQVQDEQSLHVSHIPIVEGYQQIGTDDPVKIETGVLQIYPTLSMLMHYKSLKQESPDPIDPEIRLGPVNALQYTGEYQMENHASRSVNKVKMYRSDEIPFGLAKWEVDMYREAKDPREPRDAFQRVSQVKVEMSAHEVGTNAESELLTPNAAPGQPLGR